MNSAVLVTLFAAAALSIPARACGPFFKDTVLDQPQSALASPPVSYLHDLYQMSGIPVPQHGAQNDGTERSFVLQIPLECAELREVWQQAGIGEDEIGRWIRHYEEIRKTLLAPLTEVGLMRFPNQVGRPPALPQRPLGADFPRDVADYVEAARLHAVGDAEAARTLWKEILERPAAERTLRAAWAAWMLAKTSHDRAECMAWYGRVETEVQAGATDVLDLRGAARAWRAGQLADGPIAAMRFFYDAFIAGKSSAAVDLRRVSSKILRSNDPAVLQAAAEDTLVRRLINLHLYASFDGPYQFDVDSSPSNAMDPWLAALKAQPQATMDDSARVAWALYTTGRLDDAREWLKISPKSDPLRVWLQAKFDLRDGNLEAANQHLSEVIRSQSEQPDWQPANPILDSLWSFSITEREQARQGRLMADAGILALARKDYLVSLECFRTAGYEEDAAYLAEMLISTDGLIKHVRDVAPAWTAEAAPIHPRGSGNLVPYELSPNDQLRYLLARRLARERRFTESREFMPPGLLPLLDRYIALDRARRSGEYSGLTLTAIIWEQALLHRHSGAELFSTEGAPDGGIHDWSFPVSDFLQIRTHKNGWSFQWEDGRQAIDATQPRDRPIPAITSDELRRARLYSVTPQARFHYRYTAANLAWQAAKNLPANYPLLPRLYNTAGQWLSVRDPKSADRFYQAMVRRASKTPEGQAADARRWFLPDLPPLGSMPELPKEFR